MIPAWLVYSLITSGSLVPPCFEDRGSDQTARLEVVAVSVALTTDDGKAREISRADKDLAAQLVTVAVFESALCERVHRGRTRGRGRGLWQLEQGSHAAPPFEGVSFEETAHAAQEAAKMLRRSIQCGRGVRDVFASYAGLRCGRNFKTLTERVILYWKVRRRIDELLSPRNVLSARSIEASPEGLRLRRLRAA